jgi:hypothetical protein
MLGMTNPKSSSRTRSMNATQFSNLLLGARYPPKVKIPTPNVEKHDVRMGHSRLREFRNSLESRGWLRKNRFLAMLGMTSPNARNDKS